MMKNVVTQFAGAVFNLFSEKFQWRSWLRAFQSAIFPRVRSLFFAFALLMSACAETPPIKKGPPLFQCSVEGREIQFHEHLKVTLGQEGGLSIWGISDADKPGEHLTIKLPKMKKGTYTLKDTPSMRLGYSRSMFSSNSADHFGALVGGSVSKLKVTVTFLNLKEGWIEGTFSGTAQAFPSGTVSIKDGEFKLPITDKKHSKKESAEASDPVNTTVVSKEAFALTMEPRPKWGIITEFRLTYY